MVYRFKIKFGEHEEVSRDIEIKAKQTLEDFKSAIQKAIGFDNQHNASFYLSDDQWKVGEEYNNESLKDTKLVSLIYDPHQKLLYAYGEQLEWEFYIELLKIVKEDSGIQYPHLFKSEGDAPKQYKVVKPPVVDPEDDDEIIEDDQEEGDAIFNEEESWDDEEALDDDMMEDSEGAQDEGPKID